MSATPSSASPSPPTSSLDLYKLFNSTSIDSRIAHLNRVLSTASGIDSTLCFVGYGAVFVGSQLQKLSEVNLRSISEKLGSQSSGADARAQVANLGVSVKTFGGMCSEVRTFMRLWGLLKIWAGAKATYMNPPKDSLLRLLAWGQLGAMGTYLVLENGLFLATKGVIKGWTPEYMGKRFRTAIWVFFGYLLMDYTRLARTWQLRQQQKAISGGPQFDEKAPVNEEEKQLKLKQADDDRAWWRSLHVAMSYSPLCFHWGLEGGILPDVVVGLFGASAGFAGFREALRVTAQ